MQLLKTLFSDLFREVYNASSDRSPNKLKSEACDT